MVWKGLMKQHYLKNKNFICCMEDITEVDYKNGKRICNNFEIKKIGRIS